MKIQQVTENKRAYWELLFLADEQEEMIERYLDSGEMFVLLDPEPVGECVVCVLEDGNVELKNLAVLPEQQGKGYGKALVAFVREQYKGRGSLLLVGTGDSPLTVPFYLKCGFREHHRVKDFFTENYDHPMVEAGVLLKDMVYFSMEL